MLVGQRHNITGSLFHFFVFMLLSKIAKASSSAPSLSSLHRRFLTPRDIHFDDEIRRVLADIREATAFAATTTTTTGTTQERIDNESKKSKALSSLTSAGIINDVGLTLTLIGYKGGELAKQINQDRAFVLTPFYTTGDGETPSRLGDDVDNEKNNIQLSDDIDDKKNNEEGNNRRNQKMQLMGVMDGHDTLGEVVSEYAMRELPLILSSKLNEFEKECESSSSSSSEEVQDVFVRKVLTEAFLHINATIPTKNSGGCTGKEKSKHLRVGYNTGILHFMYLVVVLFIVSYRLDIQYIHIVVNRLFHSSRFV